MYTATNVNLLRGLFRRRLPCPGGMVWHGMVWIVVAIQIYTSIQGPDLHNVKPQNAFRSLTCASRVWIDIEASCILECLDARKTPYRKA